jgi:hypothetical protein
MSVHKYKSRAGKIRWGYQFSLPGSTRKDRKRVFGSGFATKGEATDAEAARRMEEQQKVESVRLPDMGATAPPRITGRRRPPFRTRP